MGKNDKKAYLDAIRGRYRKASRVDKSKILDEFRAVCHYHRKYALRRLGKPIRKAMARQKPGKRSRFAAAEVMASLRAIWLATDQMASKRLMAAMPLWLPHYEAAHGIHADDVRHKLLTVSASTLDRLLTPVRVQVGKRGLSGTNPGTLLKHQIPLQGGGVGCVAARLHCEVDTVAHCGNSLAGDFVWSLTMTDLYSGWTECRAT